MEDWKPLPTRLDRLRLLALTPAGVRVRRRRRVAVAVVVFVVFVALALASCRASHGPPGPSSSSDDDAGAPLFGDGALTDDPLGLDASVTTRVQLVLSGCNGTESCHTAGAAGLSFPVDDVGRLLVDVPSSEQPAVLRVKPGDPDASYLLRKVRGDPGIDGDRMPGTSAPFDPRLPALLEAWVEAGAPRP